jgi:hypothetical protein
MSAKLMVGQALLLVTAMLLVVPLGNLFGLMVDRTRR